jgi:2,3-bisphosphoglycerate-independent phosphoglycerate mutase
LGNNNLEFIKELSKTTDSKIILLVIDGLGGLPDCQSGKTELQTASIPNLDALAAKSICGLSDPVSPGITSGSAPGHLAL